MRNTRGWGLFETFLAKRRAHKVAELLGDMSGKAILDIGCGNSLYLLQYTNADKVTGIRSMVDYWLPRLKPGSYDAVTMLAALEHFQPAAIPGLLQWIRGILKCGGYLIVTTPPLWTTGLLQTMAALRLVSPTEISDHKQQYGPTSVFRFLTEAEFEYGLIDWSYYDLWTNTWYKARR